MHLSPSEDGVGNNAGLEGCTVMLEEPLWGDSCKICCVCSRPAGTFWYSWCISERMKNGEETRDAAGLCLTCSSFPAPKLAALSFVLPAPARGSPVLCRSWLLRTQLLHEQETEHEKASIKPSHLQPL